MFCSDTNLKFRKTTLETSTYLDSKQNVTLIAMKRHKDIDQETSTSVQPSSITISVPENETNSGTIHYIENDKKDLVDNEQQLKSEMEVHQEPDTEKSIQGDIGITSPYEEEIMI